MNRFDLILRISVTSRVTVEGHPSILECNRQLHATMLPALVRPATATVSGSGAHQFQARWSPPGHGWMVVAVTALMGFDMLDLKLFHVPLHEIEHLLQADVGG
ncbi:hypothetical protein V6N12_067080 [Hibiscus sabdariffa]|uniref:Uncharacterized protein n=1 Tax=Hibiscus sabdariffa TaxID=183260 RepID=A0ABR2AP03_9ROSI